MLKKIEFILFILFAMVSLSGCIQKEELNIERFLPNLNYSWRLVKSEEGSTLFTPSEIPRIPKIAFEKKVSANIRGILATPLIENYIIFLADHKGTYALDDNGELIWGAEIYSNSLEERKISQPQPWIKWKAFGFNRFMNSYALGKYLFVGTSSAEKGNGYLLAFNKSTGELVWKEELKPEDSASSFSSVASLIVAEGKVCAGTIRDEGFIYCFTEEGKFLWRNKIGGNVRDIVYGNRTLFVVSEPQSIYALDIETGKRIWSYDHNNTVNALTYKKNKIFFIDSSGRLIVISSKGKRLWEKNIFDGKAIDNDSHLAIGNLIYVSVNSGEKPSNLYVINFDGNIIGEFKLKKEERAGTPVVTKNIVLLPVVSNKYAKIYFLWKGIDKLYEFKLDGEGIYMPKIGVAYGEIYVVFSPHIFIKFKDYENPRIKRIEEIKYDKNITIKVWVQDEQSGIYKTLVAYKDMEWNYIEMELVRRYFIEPIGGYGFNEEEYIVTIPDTEYIVIAIDNVEIIFIKIQQNL